MILPFGAAPSPGGADLPQRRSRISVEMLLGVVTDVLADLRTSPGLTISLMDRRSGNPLVSMEEGERRVRVGLAELARDMELARVTATAANIRLALAAWIDNRPVTDAAAAANGIAVLRWVGAAADALGWQVVVPRHTALAPWSPSVLARVDDIAATRTAASVRSLTVVVQMRQIGSAAVWTCPDHAELSTAALVCPERILLRMSRAGMPTDDMHLVVSPPGAFVSASGPAAQRIAEESSAPHVLTSWNQLDHVEWVPTR